MAGEWLPGRISVKTSAVGEEQQQRVDEAPEEAEDAAAVAGLELAADQALDEEAVAEEGPELGEHQASIFNRKARRAPSGPGGRDERGRSGLPLPGATARRVTAWM